MILIPSSGYLGKKEIEDTAQIRFRKDQHFYASYDYDFNASLKYGGNYPLALGLFNPENNKLIKKYKSPHRFSCWTVTQDGHIFVSQVNGKLSLLSPDLILLKKWSFKPRVQHCVGDNKNRIWLGTAKSGIYKIDLAQQIIEHPVKLSQVIHKFNLSADGKYFGFESVIEGVAWVRVYRVD